MSKFALLIIDPQVDFHPGGSLPVNGADDDALRIAKFIKENGDSISNIYVTLDSHQVSHIGHSAYWRNAEGSHPPPFTTISHASVSNKEWYPVDPSLMDYTLGYTKKLEERGKFQHTVWPDHCLIGTPGHCVTPPIIEALNGWGRSTLKPVNYVMKGTNVLAEMYSVFRAEVPVETDKSTELNLEMIKKLREEKKIYICGQALSHCVNYSTRDLIENWPPERISDLILLANGSSPVPGFESQAQEFVNFFSDKGGQVVYV